MIPTTPEECDAFIADVSAVILAAMNTGRRVAPPDPSLSADDRASVDRYYTAARVARVADAVAEAGALLAELQLHARVQRFPDGEVIDPRALDPTKRFCAHGVSLADDCAQCAAGDIPLPEANTSDNADAAEAFHAGLRGEPPA